MRDPCPSVRMHEPASDNEPFEGGQLSVARGPLGGRHGAESPGAGDGLSGRSHKYDCTLDQSRGRCRSLRREEPEPWTVGVSWCRSIKTVGKLFKLLLPTLRVLGTCSRLVQIVLMMLCIDSSIEITKRRRSNVRTARFKSC